MFLDKGFLFWAFLLSSAQQEATLGPFVSHRRTKQKVVLPLVLTGTPLLPVPFASLFFPCVMLKGSGTQQCGRKCL